MDKDFAFMVVTIFDGVSFQAVTEAVKDIFKKELEEGTAGMANLNIVNNDKNIVIASTTICRNKEYIYRPKKRECN